MCVCAADLPMEAASPMLMVEMSHLMWCMVSKMAKPEVTEPPGELMYMDMGLELSSASR